MALEKIKRKSIEIREDFRSVREKDRLRKVRMRAALAWYDVRRVGIG